MKNQRRFVIGDIHGHFDELKELLDNVSFQFKSDLLICLGDLVDRGPNPLEVIEKLMEVKNLIHILGNHDDWCYQYLTTNKIPNGWTLQGGITTIKAYRDNPQFKKKHIDFFEKARLFHIDEKSRLFIHGGYNPAIPFELQKDDKELIIWDRKLISAAIKLEQMNQHFSEFSEIFVGHTPTQVIEETIPTQIANLWMMDTGIYKSGKLSIMDIETKEYWQSTLKDMS